MGPVRKGHCLSDMSCCTETLYEGAEARCNNINPKEGTFHYFLGLCHKIYKAAVLILIFRKVRKYTVGDDLEAHKESPVLPINILCFVLARP